MIVPISAVYNTKRSGPKTEHCGTPQINEHEDVVVPTSGQIESGR